MNSYRCTISLRYKKFRRKTVIYAIPWKRSYHGYISFSFLISDPMTNKSVNYGPPAVYVLGTFVVLFIIAIFMVQWCPWLRPCLDPVPQKENLMMDLWLETIVMRWVRLLHVSDSVLKCNAILVFSTLRTWHWNLSYIKYITNLKCRKSSLSYTFLLARKSLNATRCFKKVCLIVLNKCHFCQFQIVHIVKSITKHIRGQINHILIKASNVYRSLNMKLECLVKWISVTEITKNYEEDFCYVSTVPKLSER